MPISAPLFILMELLIYLSRMINFKTFSSMGKVMKSLQLIWMDMGIVDFFFYSVLNISVFLRYSTYNFTRIASFLISSFILLRMVAVYLGMFLNLETACLMENLDPKRTRNKIKKKEGQMERDISLEGINDKIHPVKRQKAATVNFMFKF